MREALDRCFCGLDCEEEKGPGLIGVHNDALSCEHSDTNSPCNDSQAEGICGYYGKRQRFEFKRKPGDIRAALQPVQGRIEAMKAQMSLEMLAYVAIAGISILYSLGAVSSYYLRVNQSLGDYGYSSFVESINTAILGNYSSITLNVPEGLCNSEPNGSELDTRYGAFYFVEDVRLLGNLSCGQGTRKASIHYGQG